MKSSFEARSLPALCQHLTSTVTPLPVFSTDEVLALTLWEKLLAKKNKNNKNRIDLLQGHRDGRRRKTGPNCTGKVSGYVEKGGTERVWDTPCVLTGYVTGRRARFRRVSWRERDVAAREGIAAVVVVDGKSERRADTNNSFKVLSVGLTGFSGPADPGAQLIARAGKGHRSGLPRTPRRI